MTVSLLYVTMNHYPASLSSLERVGSGTKNENLNAGRLNEEPFFSKDDTSFSITAFDTFLGLQLATWN